MRKVSATWTSAAKDGWQQVKISLSRSSSSVASAGSPAAACVEQDLMRQLLLLAANGDGASHAVDRLVAPDIDQPGPRIGGDLADRPALQRHLEGILQGVLGQIEIADETDQRRERSARLVAEDFFDLAGVISSNFVIPRRCEGIEVRRTIVRRKISRSPIHDCASAVRPSDGLE